MRDYVIRNRFEDAFDEMIISAEVGILKPDPRIYALALLQLGTEAGRSVLVDDTPEMWKRSRDGNGGSGLPGSRSNVPRVGAGPEE